MAADRLAKTHPDVSQVLFEQMRARLQREIDQLERQFDRVGAAEAARGEAASETVNRLHEKVREYLPDDEEDAVLGSKVAYYEWRIADADDDYHYSKAELKCAELQMQIAGMTLQLAITDDLWEEGVFAIANAQELELMRIEYERCAAEVAFCTGEVERSKRALAVARTAAAAVQAAVRTRKATTR